MNEHDNESEIILVLRTPDAIAEKQQWSIAEDWRFVSELRCSRVKVTISAGILCSVRVIERFNAQSEFTISAIFINDFMPDTKV